VAWHPRDRRVAGFLSWEPLVARRGWALDLMRKRASAPPGTMEMLVVKSVETARARGDAMLSLSLSPLAKVDAPDEAAARAAAPEGDRARDVLFRHLERFYDFKGLFTWKKKFLPAFEDRYLVYPQPMALPQVVLALIRAQSPGGIRSYFRSPRTADAESPLQQPDDAPARQA
jgi:phosphatidylglycerol lysyltransferase